MHKKTFATFLAFAAAFALALPLAAQVRVDVNLKQNDAGEGKIAVAHSFRSSHLIGMRVRDKANKDIGRVDDLVVNMGKGDIRYVALSFGGFAGIGTKLFAVPWNKLTFHFGENDRFFTYDITEEQLKNAPGFDSSNWPDVADPKWYSSIDTYYKVDRDVRDDRATTDRTHADRAHDAFRVSKIKGMEVRNEQNKDLGHVDELVFDIKAGKVAYAALSFGSFAGLGGKLFAIPFHAFKFHHADNDNYLVVNISEEKLRKAPGFDSNSWPNVADPTWSRDIDLYYEAPRTAIRPGDANRARDK